MDCEWCRKEIKDGETYRLIDGEAYHPLCEIRENGHEEANRKQKEFFEEFLKERDGK